MAIYAVIELPSASKQEKHLRDFISSIFTEKNHVEIRPGIWFINSDYDTSVEVREKLNIKLNGYNGIVITVSPGRYSGVAPAQLVEKLKTWDEMQ